MAVLLGLLAASPVLSVTTLPVNSTLDEGDGNPGDGACQSPSGDCTLRAAIDEANALAGAPGEVIIQLPAGSFVLTLPGTDEDSNATGDLDIGCHLILQGAGAGATTIDADQLDRVLDIQWASPGRQVEIRHLTLTGGSLPLHDQGKRGAGGGIYNNSGVLTLVDVTVTGNRSGAGPDHYNDASDNVITESGFGGPGGGILNEGTLHLIDSLVSDNATGRGGDGQQYGGPAGNPRGDGEAGGQGGGIYSGYHSILTLLRSQVTGNHTGRGGTSYHYLDSAPAGDGGSGGGIFAYHPTTLELVESTVSGNWTGRGGHRILDPDLEPNCAGSSTECYAGAGGSGGGLATEQPSLTITDSIFSNNWTGRGGSACGECTFSGPGFGGGVFAWIDPQATVSGSTFSGNIAGKTEAGGYETEGKGGGFYQDRGGLHVAASTFSGNKAHLGGGLYYDGFAETGEIGDSTFTLNQATLGGGIFWNGAESWGSVLDFGNNILAANTATSDGPDCRTAQVPNPDRDIPSNGFNLVQDISGCGFDTQPTDQIGANPILGPLTDNGGPTPTHEPQPGSPAIEGGGGCGSVDQRGQPRPVSAFCDVGAVEVGVLAPSVTTDPATDVTQSSATLNGTADPNGDASQGWFDYGSSASYGETAVLGAIGAGHDPVPLTTDLTGLSCAATYHFRARAQNSGGETQGPDRTLVTDACTGGPPETLHLTGTTLDGEAGEDLQEACRTIEAGPNVQVLSPAQCVMRAGESVEIFSPFTVGAGASLTIELALPAGCPPP